MYPLAGEEGLEPPTLRLTAECSDQLSYIPISYTLIIPYFFYICQVFSFIFFDEKDL